MEAETVTVAIEDKQPENGPKTASDGAGKESAPVEAVPREPFRPRPRRMLPKRKMPNRPSSANGAAT